MDRLRKHLQSLGYDVAEDATNEEVQFIAMKAIEDGKLSTKELTSFKADEDRQKADRAEFAKQVGEAAAAASSVSADALAGAMAKAFQGLGLVPAQTDEAAQVDETEAASKEADEVHTKSLDAAKAHLAQGAEDTGAGAQVVKAMTASRGDSDATIEVKSVYGKFSNKGYEQRHPETHPMRGQVIHDIYGAPLPSTSELENAKFLAFFKLQTGLSLGPVEKSLCRAMIEEDTWCNLDDGSKERNGTVKRKLNDSEKAHWIKRLDNTGMTKASLLDDATSGGEDAVPVFYDMRGIVEPLVVAQLSGLVTTIDIPRGSTVQNFTMGNVTVVKTAEGTAITPFDATSLIAAKTYTVFPASVVIDVGVDLLQDAVPQLGNLLRGRISAAFSQYVDEQICLGDGTTEPLGIANAVDVIDVNPTTATTGPWTIADVINLFFAPNKAHREDFGGAGQAYAMSDTSYARVRSLATGITGDNRLLFGETLDSYKLFGKDVRVPAALTNAVAIFGNFKGYTWYRRQAPQFRVETGGRANALSHIGQVIGRMRNAGAPNLGTYFGLIDDAQT